MRSAKLAQIEKFVVNVSMNRCRTGAVVRYHGRVHVQQRRSLWEDGTSGPAGSRSKEEGAGSSIAVGGTEEHRQTLCHGQEHERCPLVVCSVQTELHRVAATMEMNSAHCPRFAPLSSVVDLCHPCSLPLPLRSLSSPSFLLRLLQLFVLSSLFL